MLSPSRHVRTSTHTVADPLPSRNGWRGGCTQVHALSRSRGSRRVRRHEALPPGPARAGAPLHRPPPLDHSALCGAAPCAPGDASAGGAPISDRMSATHNSMVSALGVRNW
eukprot:4955060-Prymnesium_polylepis.1